jgi:two-component system response regulator MprA
VQTTRVLVIDDDHDLREAVAESLTDEGYAVDAFESGELALAHLRKGGQATLILLDWMMPGMDGGRVNEELRKEPRLAAIPIILITADTRASQKAEQLGLLGYLRKPLQLDELLNLVGRYAGAPKRA